MIGPIRNNPVSLLKSGFAILILAFVGLSSIRSAVDADGMMVGIFILVAAAVIILLILRIWQKTTFTFTDTEIIVNKDTLFKKKKTIPYSKIASINVVRSIFDRIFGTSTLSFNVNSGVNAATPEAVMVASKELADTIYSSVHAAMIGEGSIAAEEHVQAEKPQSVVKYNAFDIILHGFLSSPTWTLLYNAIFLAYSIYGLFVDSTAFGGAIVTTFMFISSLIVPVVTKIVRYFNFSVYRVEDTIYLDHGLFRKYHSEFKMSKINSVKIQKPFFGRLIGKCYLQAEVVGINAVQGDVSPTICLMTTESRIMKCMNELLPEFIFEGETIMQPKQARVPIYAKSGICLIIMAVTVSMVSLTINGFFNPDLKISEGLLALTNSIIFACAAVIMVLLLFGGHESMKTKDYVIGKDMFTFTNGIVDRTVAVVQYDRVQAVYLRSGPIARRHSLAKCRVSLLSAAGGSRTGSGYFLVEDLNKIPDTMLRRLEDGSYDYRKNTSR